MLCPATHKGHTPAPANTCKVANGPGLLAVSLGSCRRFALVVLAFAAALALRSVVLAFATALALDTTCSKRNTHPSRHSVHMYLRFHNAFVSGICIPQDSRLDTRNVVLEVESRPEVATLAFPALPGKRADAHSK